MAREGVELSVVGVPRLAARDLHRDDHRRPAGRGEPDLRLTGAVGAGSTVALLKDKGLCSYAVGVDISQEALEIAKNVCDEVYLGDIEKLELPLKNGDFDAILLLDTLEHLVDPWKILHDLTKYLAKDGVVIVSLPNLRNYKVISDLLFKGDWKYENSGVLDRTHLRFFTKKTAISLVVGAGLKVIKIAPLYSSKFKPFTLKGMLNLLSLGLLKRCSTVQYLISAKLQ